MLLDGDESPVHRCPMPQVEDQTCAVAGSARGPQAKA